MGLVIVSQFYFTQNVNGPLDFALPMGTFFSLIQIKFTILRLKNNFQALQHKNKLFLKN